MDDHIPVDGNFSLRRIPEDLARVAWERGRHLEDRLWLVGDDKPAMVILGDENDYWLIETENAHEDDFRLGLPDELGVAEEYVSDEFGNQWKVLPASIFSFEADTEFLHGLLPDAITAYVRARARAKFKLVV